MGGGRIVLLTLIGGGSVALTAFAVKYYLSRKAILQKSESTTKTTFTTASAVTTTTSTTTTTTSEEENLVESPTATSAEVEAPSPSEAPGPPGESAPPESEIVVVEANEVSTIPTALKVKEDAEAESPADEAVEEKAKVVTTPVITVDKPVAAGGDDLLATPPTALLALIQSDEASTEAATALGVVEGPKTTPPTPPSTPMPPSRGDEEIDEAQAASRKNPMELIQEEIQGRLQAVKPRYISTDSLGGEIEDDGDDAPTDKIEEVEGVDEGLGKEERIQSEAAGEAISGDVGVSASTSKLLPISEEAGLVAASSSEVSAASASPAPEVPPKSPYMRRKRLSVQPEAAAMKIYEDDKLKSVTPSPDPSTPKSAATAALEVTPPPRQRRRSERRSTEEIKMEDVVAASSPAAALSLAASPSGSNGSQDSRGSKCDVRSEDATDSLNDFSFLSDADAAVDAAFASASAAAPGEIAVDLLEGIEDVTLDDVLRDMSSMSQSLAGLMTSSMLVEVDGPVDETERKASGAGDGMAQVDEDLAKHLNLVDKLVLDDNFFGGASNEIDFTKSEHAKFEDDDDLPDLIINDPRPKNVDDDDDAFDLHVNIGFKENDVMTASLDSAAMLASTSGEFENAAMITSLDSDTLSVGDWAAAADNASEREVGSTSIDAAASKAKPPKRVVRSRRDPPSSKNPRAKSPRRSSTESSTPSTSSSAPSTASSAPSTKSPPAKTPRGSGKRSGIPRPGGGLQQP